MNSLLKDKIIYQILTMKRGYKQVIMIVADLMALPLALWSGFALRLSDWWPEQYLQPALLLFCLTPILGVYVFMRLGLYRSVVRFMGTQAIWAVIKGVSCLAVALWALAFFFQISPFPRSIPINFALVTLVYVGGSRLLVRCYYHWALKRHMDKKAVLIYGAGGAGVQLAHALSDGSEYYPVGFIDDDKSLWGVTLKGLSVYAPASLDEVIIDSDVEHILMAVPNVSNKERRLMLEKLTRYSVHVQSIPSMPELLSGQASIEQLREVQIEDLLGRESVPSMQSLLTKCIESKVILVTGAGGSIGSELCRQIIRQRPKQLILYEMSEYHLYQIEQELRKIMNAETLNIELVALLGSVSNNARIDRVFKRYSIQTVYHAAAYKHVPIVEHNIIEGVFNNVFGTNVVAEAAANSKAENFILVSTDKAVRPTNIMGATKRFAELILQGLSEKHDGTVFSIVRFGNVLGSSGSVVPLFRKQIAAGGPVTVTHEEITRYFMTIPEAASLVIQAGSMSKGGDVFVLDMGEPVKIIDLARRMINLSGLEVRGEENPDGDISIECTGLRPAEKLYEELLLGSDVEVTEHVKIMRANEDSLSVELLSQLLLDMRVACDEGNYFQVRAILLKAVIDYQPHDSIVDYLYVDSNSTSNVVRLS